jgi:hypothetical protein
VRQAVFGHSFKAGDDGLLELADAFAGDTEEFPDLFQRLFAVKQPIAALNDLTLTVTVDRIQDIGNRLFNV